MPRFSCVILIVSSIVSQSTSATWSATMLSSKLWNDKGVLVRSLSASDLFLISYNVLSYYFITKNLEVCFYICFFEVHNRSFPRIYFCPTFYFGFTQPDKSVCFEILEVWDGLWIGLFVCGWNKPCFANYASLSARIT